MFRFLALAWSETAAEATAHAASLVASVQALPQWTCVLERPGLRVWAAGVRPGVNGPYPLLPDAGVVLGKLFRRRDLGVASALDVTLTLRESELALKSAGRSLTSDFWGRYVAFMQDEPGSVTVLRDPSGTLPCHWMRHRDVWMVFSWLEDVLDAWPSVPVPDIADDGLAAHVLFGALGNHDTTLAGVQEVLPGERLTLRDGDVATTAPTWRAADFATQPADELPAAAAMHLRTVVQGCARAWATSYPSILLRLSGGVDSSILLSCLDREHVPGRLTCLNYHSVGADSDERHYARQAASRAGRDLIERERESALRLERVLDVALTPSPGTYIGRIGTGRTDAALAASLGAAALFTGGGGDQLFFEFLTWWPAADYLRLRGPDAGFGRAVLAAARLSRTSVWTVLRHAIGERFRPTDPMDAVGRLLTLAGQAARETAKQRARFTHPALLNLRSLPVGKANHLRQLVHSSGYYDPYERAHAPELVNPLLSQPIVELCLSMPTYLLTHGGRGRGLARMAFASELPAEIANRKTKGGMEDHVKALLLGNLDFARRTLLDGELVRRDILDRGKVAHAFSGRPSALASHMGEFHVYIGIEAWIAAWRSRRAGRQDRAGHLP